MKELIGQSKSIQQVRKKVQQLSKSRSNVVIIGEPGVGKSVVAENIHYQSIDAAKPFAHLNVAQIDELKLRSLVQSLLTRREFINPTTSEHGNFQLPVGATIIIDDLEKAGLAAQRIVCDLLEDLEGKEYGLRLIFLFTNEVKELVKGGGLIDAFRKLLKGSEVVQVPPLRKRQDDIPELIEHFVHQAAKELELGEVIIDINAISLLVRREWKGNVQELKTFVEQVMMLSEDKETFTLPESLVDEQSELTRMLERIDRGIDFALDRSMALIEKRILERVLKKFGSNQSRAARFLKITEDTLRYRMKKLGIPTSHESQ